MIKGPLEANFVSFQNHPNLHKCEKKTTQRGVILLKFDIRISCKLQGLHLRVLCIGSALGVGLELQRPNFCNEEGELMAGK